MDLMLSGDFAKRLLLMTKKDKKLAEAIARQFLQSIDSSSLAAYLLSTDVATNLLADRIMNNPEKTLHDLQRLPAAEAPVDGRTTRRGAAAPSRAAGKVAPRAAKKGGKRRRHRLTLDELTRIKQQISSFLTKNPWSTRKEIAAAVSFPTVAAYNRIMNELKDEKVIVSQGEKSKTVYALHGAGKRSGAAKRAAGGRPAKVAKRATARGAKRVGRQASAKRTKAAKTATPAKPSKRGRRKKAAPAEARKRAQAKRAAPPSPTPGPAA